MTSHTFARSSNKHHDTLSPEETRHKEAIRANIEVVSREYEEEFLREPLGTERPCVMGDNCQGHQLYHIKSDGFTLREFLLPRRTKSSKERASSPKMDTYASCASAPRSHGHSSIFARTVKASRKPWYCRITETLSGSPANTVWRTASSRHPHAIKVSWTPLCCT